jgi:hypothetical protein
LESIGKIVTQEQYEELRNEVEYLKMRLSLSEDVSKELDKKKKEMMELVGFDD